MKNKCRGVCLGRKNKIIEMSGGKRLAVCNYISKKKERSKKLQDE